MSSSWIEENRALILAHHVLGPAVLRVAVDNDGDTVFHFDGLASITLMPWCRRVVSFSPACGGFTTLERLVDETLCLSDRSLSPTPTSAPAAADLGNGKLKY